MLSVTACCAERGKLCWNFHVAITSNTFTKESIMTFAAKELLTFSNKS